ncbi:hypothetical protein FNW02_06090 [Komarekiella sp. 'clone 1']|uniref:Uncharacterized protein n=1 Tax=Komarekiella delphini-convector SJRDD-AB1 TaxID=2593771 RepID=A0AA40SUF9_9NOST|nr:hypothetical protein [Komarekiella delphini-convector]MBD6615425.1 hypothetical protein [Komarekiella delphini-convector SJRDD-AB1]
MTTNQAKAPAPTATMSGVPRMAAITPVVIPAVFAIPSEFFEVEGTTGVGCETRLGSVVGLLGLEATTRGSNFEQYSGSGVLNQCTIGEQEC